MGSLCARIFGGRNTDPSKPEGPSTGVNPYTIPIEVTEDFSEDAPPIPPRPIVHSPPPTKVDASDNEQLQLLKPIYIARNSYQAQTADGISFDVGDEFEFICNTDNQFFKMRHLRSAKTGQVPKNSVQLDPDTPIRLGVTDKGTIERCLFKYNVLFSYLIRRSENKKNYVLSVNQPNPERNTLCWHYLIETDPINHRFYLSLEEKLKHKSYSSFSSLVQDPDLLSRIPLKEPISKDFIINKDELWKIDYNELALGHVIGRGEFGEVQKGEWHQKNGNVVMIAVKRLTVVDQALSEFERETRAMQDLRSTYLVSLFGTSIDPITHEKLMITEFMEQGDLKSYLKSQSTAISDHRLMQYAGQTCRGMAYLEQHNYAHRDLACRNILLTNNNVKIADFGLSLLVTNNENNDIRRIIQQQKLPFRWTAPEIFIDTSKYSLKSDIWAYGIVLIEMWTKGDDPYPGKHPEWIRSAVQDGIIHERPDTCPKNIYDQVIKRCFARDPNERPAFAHLSQILNKIAI